MRNPDQISRRRRFILGVFAAVILLSLFGVLSPFDEESNSEISSATVLEASDYDLPDGFTHQPIVAEVDGETAVIGSVFFLDDDRAKAEFITKDLHPDDFDAEGRPDFDAIQSRLSERGDAVAFVTAGAFFTVTGQTQGVALEDGQMVGEAEVADFLNGLLVIEAGIPRIEYFNQIPDFTAFLDEAQKGGWDLFQQASYVRPGGIFESSKDAALELRFFVEGEGEKAIIDFTEKMTYTEAVSVLEHLDGFKIEKAIGLDTGIVSEARFFDREGTAYPLIDEQFGQEYSYTNVVVFYGEL